MREIRRDAASGLRFFFALLLGVTSNLIASAVTSQIDFSSQTLESSFRLTLISLVIFLAVWFGILTNPFVRSFFAAQSDFHHALKSVRTLVAQYKGLALSLSVDGQQRFPEYELPEVMGALASGVRQSIRAVYVITPETFIYEGGHTDQEGHYFKACEASAHRIALERPADVIRRIFLISQDVVASEIYREKVLRLVERHSQNDLFSVKVFCPAPTRPASDFALYDDNAILKLELAMSERRISSGLVYWNRNAIAKYEHVWNSLWKSAEAKTPAQFKTWCNSRVVKPAHHQPAAPDG